MYDYLHGFSVSKLLTVLIVLLAVLLNPDANLNPLFWAVTVLLGGSNPPSEQSLSESASNPTNPNPPTTGNGG